MLFHPVTDAAFDTGSYRRFAQGDFLTWDDMKWFWDQRGRPGTDHGFPLRATREQAVRSRGSETSTTTGI
ncbi:hypothetical protein ACWCPQ_04055 [Nocardia sp. NPDC001965]